MTSDRSDGSTQLSFDRLVVVDVMTMDPVTVGVDPTVAHSSTARQTDARRDRASAGRG